MDSMGFLVYDRFLEFSFRSSQFCSLLVYVTLPLRDTPNQFPTYIYSFFSISLNTNIILLEDSFSLLSLYLFQVYDPISWMEKSPRFYRFLKLCNSCLRLLILQIHFFLPLSTSTVLTTSKGVDDVSVKISSEKLEIRRLECAEACLTLNDAEV